MQTGIEIIAQAAYPAGENMIGVYPARPAVHREIVATLAEAIALKNKLLTEHESINVYAHTRHTRSPRGYKGNEHLCRGDNVRAGKRHD